MTQILEKETATMPESIPAERVLRKRIGSTTVEVVVHFSRTSRETMEDKLLRMIERDPLVCFANWPGGHVGANENA